MVTPFSHRHGLRAEAGEPEADVIVQWSGPSMPPCRWIRPLGARVPAARGIMVRISDPTGYELTRLGGRVARSGLRLGADHELEPPGRPPAPTARNTGVAGRRIRARLTRDSPYEPLRERLGLQPDAGHRHAEPREEADQRLGSLATLASRTIRPVLSTTQTLLRSSETSIPA